MIFTKPKGTELNKSLIIEAIIWNEHSDRRGLFNLLEGYYDGQHPILSRSKLLRFQNEKVVVNHAEYISDLYTGYIFGTPIDIQGDENIVQPIKELMNADDSNIWEVDADLGQDCSIYGRAYEYIFADEDGRIISKKIKPQNCVIIYDNTFLHKKMYAVIYGQVHLKKDSITLDPEEIRIENVTVLDETSIYTYNDKILLENVEQHYFGVVPVVDYFNTSKARGDFHSVMSLIDAYNIIVSDSINDKVQFVESILAFYGFQITDEEMSKLKEDKVLLAPAKLNGASAEYLQRALIEGDIEILARRIEQLIHKISKTPNMSDQNFIGNSSGVALEYKLIPFEQRSKLKERFFVKGYKDRLKLYANYLKAKQNYLAFDLNEIEIKFSRTLPKNDMETSQMINNLDGKVDDETLIQRLSFVDDASRVIEKVQEQKKENMQNFAPEFGTNQPTQGNNLTVNNNQDDRDI